MTTFAIETHHLRKEFGEKVAVADLSLQVPQGEVFGFLGPNGAGKTTSIKMLLSLVKPTAGEGQLLGDPLGRKETRGRVGYLPEHFRFHEWLTATEFLELNGRLYGMDKKRITAVIPDLLALVGLDKRAQTRLEAFSKGMMQRIGLAQALMNDPALVFLDEPTSGLDPLGRRLVRDIIHGLKSEGTTVFLNSHLLSEVEQTCDRVAFIRDGRVLETIRMEELTQETIQVTLRVGQPDEPFLQSLAEFGHGLKIHAVNGRVHLSLPHEKHLPALAQWIITNGHALYELTPHRQTLEERFLQVIGTQSGDMT